MKSKILGNTILIICLSFLYLGLPVVTFAATTPSLGVTSSFGIFTNNFNYANNGTTITGDLGYTISSGIGTYNLNGTTYISDTTYNQAKIDQGTILSTLDNQACTFTFGPGIIDLATDTTHGVMGVYTPGVYCISSMVPFVSIGTSGITLDGNGTYIFRVNGSLNTATNSTVTLINGASACDVFWTLNDNVITSTLGAYSKFVGTIIDTVGLTIKDHLFWTGRVLLSDGFVSINEKDNISIPTSCYTPPVLDKLKIIKTVINDNGGTATSSDFNLHVKSFGSFGVSDVVGSPAVGISSPGRDYLLSPNNYIVSEDSHVGYTSTFSGDCDQNGNIIVGSGTKTCIITNDDIYKAPPIDTLSTLKIIKTVINDNGGIATSSDFNLHVKSFSSFGVSDVAGSPAVGISSSGRDYLLSPNNYIVSEDSHVGYTSTFSGDCDQNGNIIVGSGTKTCIITNDDIYKTPPIIIPPIITPPIVIEPKVSPKKLAILYVIKYVINGSGSIAISSDFIIHVKKLSIDVTGSPAPGVSGPGRKYLLPAGIYNISENNNTLYKQKIYGDCNSSGDITLSDGDKKTCIIVNTSIPKISKVPPTKIISVIPKIPKIPPAKITSVVINKPIPILTNSFDIAPHFPNTGISSSISKSNTLPKLANTGSILEKKIGLPVRLKIPSIHVNTIIEHVGINTKGEMDVPKGHNNSAWFNLGPNPGENGSAVIDGHFGIWKNGKATIFNNLHKLLVGDKITVEDENGIITTFIVRELRIYDPDDNTSEVFISHDGKIHLNFITCSGAWNKVKKSYPKRLVVFTDKE